MVLRDRRTRTNGCAEIHSAYPMQCWHPVTITAGVANMFMYKGRSAAFSLKGTGT